MDIKRKSTRCGPHGSNSLNIKNKPTEITTIQHNELPLVLFIHKDNLIRNIYTNGSKLMM